MDPNELWTKQFQQTFTSSYSSRTFERTGEGTTTEIINSKADEEFRNQFKAFKNNEDMSKINIEKKDDQDAAMMSIQGII